MPRRISMAAFAGGLVSPDGSLVYTLNPFVDEPALDITKLAAGTRIAHIPVTLDTSGARGMRDRLRGASPMATECP